MLIKPVTYVNLSGNAVFDLLNEFSCSPEDMLVVYDEINLEPENTKLN
ncbi:MAG: hypothetical protein IPI12_06165 [Ignavibacteriales bacterium]|nr:hypothetical protein [Ignavibacteriales bacterium]